MKAPFAGLLYALFAGQCSATALNSFAVRDVRLFDGTRVEQHETVLVKNGVIVAVGQHIAVPRNIRVIAGAGRTLLPGLIDSHVHVFNGAQRAALRFGVTTELDMFHNGPELPSWRSARASLRRTDEADTWSAGVGATAPGGHPSEFGPPNSFPTIASASDAKKFVDDRVASGADYIKIFIEDLSEFGGTKRLPTLSREEVCALVAAAHARGKLAIVHAEAQAAATEALECGADGLAHLFVDHPANAGFIKSAKDKGLFVITTAGVYARQSGYLYQQLFGADPRAAKFLTSRQRRTLEADGGRLMPSFFPNALETIRALHDAGIPLLAGTDAPNPGEPHGLGLHLELRILVQGGLSPLEALRAATSLPAKIFGLPGRGNVRPGDRADLLMVDGDPTREIADTLSIARVWKNGFPVARSPALESTRTAGEGTRGDALHRAQQKLKVH